MVTGRIFPVLRQFKCRIHYQNPPINNYFEDIKIMKSYDGRTVGRLARLGTTVVRVSCRHRQSSYVQQSVNIPTYDHHVI